MSRRSRSILLVSLLGVVLLWVAIPVFLIMPFKSQTPAMLAVSYFLRRWSPWITVAGLVAALVLVARLWAGSRAWQRALAALVLLPLGGAAWFARQNHFEWMFAPLADPAYVRGIAADFVNPGDMVLGVVLNGDAAAWPVNQLAYHHVVNTEVGGVPIAATYWTLCHTGVVWQAALDGRAMKFRLSGINNQNFLMTDEETGSWWQQISGQAVAGPLKGRRLTRVFHDEVAFRLWLREHPGTRVLLPASDTAWINFSRNWEEETAKMPVATRVRLTDSLPQRTLVLGLELNGESKAWTMRALEKQLLIIDRLGGSTVALVLGEDGKSVRAFEPRIDSALVELFVVPGSSPLLMQDGRGNTWDWSGVAVSGPLAGRKLQPLPVIKDYWFDWKTYHPGTAVYNLGSQ